MSEAEQAVCPRCGYEVDSIVDRGAYIYEICRDCRLIRCPPFTAWESYESIEGWTTTFQAIKPPAVFNNSQNGESGE